MRSFQNRVYSESNEFAPMGANSLIYEMTPENDRVDSPEIRMYMVDPMWDYVDHGGNRSEVNRSS